MEDNNNPKDDNLEANKEQQEFEKTLAGNEAETQENLDFKNSIYLSELQ